MVQINFAQKEIQCKIVYYGPGMSGKTTNLEVVHGKVPEAARGELTSIATTGERTLYFDYMPLDLGQIAGIKTKFQLYTVPGQVYYKSTRRLVLQGVDGVVFVADSSAAKLAENKESLADLEENLKEMGKSIKDVPVVIQYNKRDMPDAMSVADLERELNPHGLPHIEAIAKTGEGVFPTLKDLSARVLEAVNKGGLGSPRAKPAVAKAGEASSTVVARAPTAIAAPRTSSAPAHALPAAPARMPMPAAAAARATPSFSGHIGAATAVAERPSARLTSAHPQPSHAPATTHGESYSPKSLQDRVVAVSGMGHSGMSGKLVLLLVLGAAAAAAAYFVLVVR